MEEKTQSTPKTMISISDLHKSYGKKDVLVGLNLDVHEGELFGFIGRNGIGKSTTIDCMIGSKKFSSGTITLDEFDVSKNPLEAKMIYGYVASEPTCYEEMTGYDYLEFIASIYQMNEGDFRRNTEYLCNRLQLKLDELSNPIGDYSHGMKQKVALISALAHNPKVLIMDEPFVGLDPKAVYDMKELMKQMAKEGKTVLFSTHILDVAEKFEKMTGRKYGFFEEYKLEDAEIAIVCMNSTAGTTKAVVDSLRAQGIKAGLLKIRVFRPFPAEEVAKVLSNLKAVAILDKSDSVNAAGGPLFEDITSAMYAFSDEHVPMVNYVYGIGGRDTTTKDIESVYKDLQDIVSEKEVKNPYRFLGLRKGGK